MKANEFDIKKLSKYGTPTQQLFTDVHEEVYVADEIEVDGGIRIFVRGAEYPQNGFASTTILFAFGTLKRLIAKYPYVLLNIKKFADIGMHTVSPYLLKEEYQQPITKEIKKFIEHLTGNSEVGEILSHIIEFDDAYRMRLGDIMSEANFTRLKKYPILELYRLEKLYRERDVHIYGKLKWIIRLGYIILLIPKFRRKFKKALEQVTQENVVLSPSDFYWGTVKEIPYFFKGKTNEENKRLFKKFPQKMKLKYE